MGKSCAQAMASSLDLVGGKLLFESFYFINKVSSHGFYCFVKASMNFAVTFGPLVELRFQGVKINKPVI